MCTAQDDDWWEEACGVADDAEEGYNQRTASTAEAKQQQQQSQQSQHSQQQRRRAETQAQAQALPAAGAPAEVPAEVVRAVFAHAGAALGGRSAACAACVSRAWRAAAGPHGVVRAALGSCDVDERIRGCKAVAVAAARAGARANEGAASAALKCTFDALLEAMLRDGEAYVRRASARALWVLSGGDVTAARAKAMAEALDGEALFTLEGHGNLVTSVCFSPDGRWLASGSYDGTVRLWDVETGACVRTLQGHGDFVTSVCFSPDGRMVASGSADETVRLWDVETGACIRTLEGHDGQVTSVRFSADGRMVASDYFTVRLWDAATGACVKTLEGHDSEVLSARFSADGRMVASGSEDETVRLWLLV